MAYSVHPWTGGSYSYSLCIKSAGRALAPRREFVTQKEGSALRAWCCSVRYSRGAPVQRSEHVQESRATLRMEIESCVGVKFKALYRIHFLLAYQMC